MIIIANTEAVIAMTGVMMGVRVGPGLVRRTTCQTTAVAVIALAMMIGAKVGGKTCATAAEAQMTNGAAEVAV
jgi:hypothetical protein